MMRIFASILVLLLVTACGENKSTTENPTSTQDQPDAKFQVSNGDYTTSDETGTLTITDHQNDQFSFSISVVTKSADCTGEITGVARKNDSGSWDFEDSDTACGLTFASVDGVITVAESSQPDACDHGASCSFAGTYRRQDESPSASAPAKPLNNILDYYLALPDTYFNCELTMERLPDQRMPGILYKNVSDGYLLFKTEELDTVQLALFNEKSTGKKYLAYVYECGGGCQCNRRAFLSYDNGEWNDVSEKAFPDLSALTSDDTNIAFRLPEKGTTIVLYNYDDPGKVVGKLEWKGNMFELVR
jgi:hypothetical protein